MLNLTILEGRLTRDPELRTTNSGKEVATFTLACDRPKRKGREQQADFIKVIVWQKSAELLTNYFRKGDGIQVQGHIRTRNYDDKNGNKVYVTEVEAYNIDFPLTGRAKSNANTATSRNNTANQAPAAEDPFVETKSIGISDDDLPF